MPVSAAPGRQGMFTGAAAVLLCAGVFLLFYSLYHQGLASALIGSAIMFAATVICWIFSALSAQSS
jgi:hypothetical protein